MIRLLQPGKTAFVSSFAQQECGTATFTSDWIRNICAAGQIEFCPSVIAVDSEPPPTYLDPVKRVIRRDTAADYIDAADYINAEAFDAVSLQHELGLFGGEGGCYVNLLLKRLRVPVITTLHTVLQDPSPAYAGAMVEVCQRSDAVVVMNKRGIDVLADVYNVPRAKIRLIPHGVPDVPFSGSSSQEAVPRRKIILTFGLISRNKGVEVMLKAMPAIIKQHPETLYVVLGAIHPGVAEREGRAYRYELQELVKNLNLQKHVHFDDTFVHDLVLQEFLIAADICVTPYHSREQMTSRTLAFAVGAGKAVVSTPYWAAEELLAEGRGRLVPFGDSVQMAAAVTELLDDAPLRHAMQSRAYEYGRTRTWPKVGAAYWKLLCETSRSPMASLSLCPRSATLIPPATYRCAQMPA